MASSIPKVEADPDHLDRVTIGGVVFHIDHALITAKLIYDACLLQTQREREAREMSRQIQDELMSREVGLSDIAAAAEPAKEPRKKR